MPPENDKWISNLQTIQGSKEENTSPKKKKKMLRLRMAINWLQSYHFCFYYRFCFYFLWEDNIVFYRFMIFIGRLVCFKKHLSLYVEVLGYKGATMLVTFVCITYFTSQICVNLTRDTFPVLSEKKGDGVCIFSWNHDVWMFDNLNEHDGIYQFSC